MVFPNAHCLKINLVLSESVPTAMLYSRYRLGYQAVYNSSDTLIAAHYHALSPHESLFTHTHTHIHTHTHTHEQQFKTNHFHRLRAPDANCCCCSCCSRISGVKHGVLTVTSIATVVREIKYNVVFGGAWAQCGP